MRFYGLRGSFICLRNLHLRFRNGPVPLLLRNLFLRLLSGLIHLLSLEGQAISPRDGLLTRLLSRRNLPGCLDFVLTFGA